MFSFQEILLIAGFRSKNNGIVFREYGVFFVQYAEAGVKNHGILSPERFDFWYKFYKNIRVSINIWQIKTAHGNIRI